MAQKCEQLRRMPDALALRVDDLLGLACSAAGAAVGDESPIWNIRKRGLELALFAIHILKETKDPDDPTQQGLLLTQYTSQLASALRANLGSNSPIFHVARDLLLLLIHCGLLEDVTQAKRLFKHALSDIIPPNSKTKQKFLNEEQTTPSHTILIQALERASLAAELQYLNNYDEDTSQLKQKKMQALIKAYIQGANGPKPWRETWYAAFIDAIRLRQGIDGWPKLEKPRIQVGQLYDISVDISSLESLLLKLQSLFAAAYTLSSEEDGEDEENKIDTILAAAVYGLSSNQEEFADVQICLQWLTCIRFGLIKKYNEEAVNALPKILNSYATNEQILSAALRLITTIVPKYPQAAFQSIALILVHHIHNNNLSKNCQDAALKAAAAISESIPAENNHIFALALKFLRSNDILMKKITKTETNMNPQIIAGLPSLAAARFIRKDCDVHQAKTLVLAWLNASSTSLHNSQALILSGMSALAEPLLNCDDSDLVNSWRAQILIPLLSSAGTSPLLDLLTASLLPIICISLKRFPHADTGLALLSTVTNAPKIEQRPALLASLLSKDHPFSALLDSIDATGDALLKLARADSNLFRSAIALLDTEFSRPHVEAAMRAAMSRFQQQQQATSLSGADKKASVLAAPPAATSSSSLKIDMRRYQQQQ